MPRIHEVKDSRDRRRLRRHPSPLLGVTRLGAGSHDAAYVARGEIRLRDPAQLRDRFPAASRVAVTRQIDEIDTPASRAARTAVEIEAIQVREPGLAGR